MRMVRAVLGFAILFFLFSASGSSTAASVGVREVSGPYMKRGAVFEIDYRGPETHTYVPPPELKRGPKTEYRKGSHGNRKKLHG